MRLSPFPSLSSSIPAPQGLRRWLLAILLASGVFSVAHLASPTLFEGVDWLQLHQPAHHFMAQALRAGRLPLWNPYVSLGRPFLADVETAVFYPPHLLYLVLDPVFGFTLLSVAHHVLAILGMLGLGRQLGFTDPASWLCAALFVSSQALVSRLQSGQAHYAHAIDYLPLLLLLVVRFGEAVTARRVAVLSIVLALQLLRGHPQIAWISWFGLAAFLLGSVQARAQGWLAEVRPLLALLAAILCALALASPTLLPFLELVGEGNRAARTLESSGAESMALFHWTSLVVPNGAGRTFYWEFNLFSGTVTLVGGLAGLATGWRTRHGRGLLLLALLGALLAAGTRTPAFALIHAVVPGASVFRLPARAALLVVLALLGGLASLLSRGPSRGALAAVLLGSGVGLVLILGHDRWLLPGLASADPLSRLPWLLAVTLLLAGLVSTAPGRPRRLALAALALITCIEVASALPGPRRAWVLPVLRGGEAPLHALLEAQHLDGPGGAPPRVALPPTLIRENAGVFFGWSNLGGYQAVSLSRVWDHEHAFLGVPAPLETTYLNPDIYDRGPFPYNSMNLVAGVDPRSGGVVVRSDADPRAYVALAARTVSGPAQATALMRDGHDFHQVALVEPGAPALPAAPDAAARAEVRLAHFEPERLVLEARSDATGLLVVAEPWYPGWQARVDGHVAPCLPVNAWMRGVPLAAGSHEVVLSFRSRWLAPGLALSALTLLGLSGAALLGRGGPP